jgi:uncharacterized protein (DUF1684 family)
MPSDEYLGTILKWRKEMDDNLRRENDLLAAAGLFWLKPGNNTFGSSRDCDICLPAQAPRLVGAFEFDGKNVRLSLDMGQSAELNGTPIQTQTMLKDDLQDSPSYVKVGGFCMVVLRRADKVGIRLWDNTRAARRTFPPRSWFPIDEKYRIPALYSSYPMPMKSKMFNAFGEWEENYMQGYVTFNLRGRTHSLDANERSDGTLYIQFTDPTNRDKTYSKGRYLYSEFIHEDGRVFLDFNKAFNPPSAFTDYATCTFAPNQNYLNTPIEAGEIFVERKFTQV